MSGSDLLSRLQDALGTAYRIERELPAGGMSRLFLADETSLARLVVIKVLPPEMASEVSAARFKQEMAIAARLQHPHVLPILTAGAKGDLLYYVMPYMAGESLRHRLATHGALPVREAVGIMREIADALTVAHREGVLHRDIKPENILLEEGHALLADFGVARALEQARSQLTGTGLAVGTPAYMAPEQVAAEPDVDGRADIYSLALVGYEMLTGTLPFAGRSPQHSLAAQLTQQPPPIAALRADAPPAVTAAIARALATNPADRFGTAQEFRDALDDAAATGPTAARRSAWSRATMAVAVAAAVIVLVAIWAVLSRPRQPQTLDANLVAVAPFDVLDPALALWHEGFVDVLSRNLDGAGPLRTVSPSVVIRNWAGRGDPASARALGEHTGARYTVFGGLIRTGADSVRATASLLDVSNGRVIADVERRDASARMDRLSDSLTVALIRELGRLRDLGPLRLSSVGTTSLPALKAFLQGEQDLRRSAWDSAADAFQRALSFDTTFALAYRGTVQALGWQSSNDPRVEVNAALAARYNHGLSPRDSTLIIADSLFQTMRNAAPGGGADRKLFKTLVEGTRRYPEDPDMWYELGDARFHFASTSSVHVTAREILANFDRAIALDSSFTPAYIHATELGFFLGGAALGRRYATAYLARAKSDPTAEGIRIANALAGPDAQRPEVRQMLDTASADALQWAATSLSRWPDSAETAVRLARLARGRRVIVAVYGDTMYQRARIANLLAQRGHLREAFAIDREDPELPMFGVVGAIPADTVNAIVLPWITDAAASSRARCPPCALPWIAFRGDTATLRRALRLIDKLAADPHQALPPDFATAARSLIHAYLVLARRDTAAALAAFDALPDSLCPLCAPNLLRGVLLERAGQDRAAEHVLEQWHADRGMSLTLTELERARVAERLGERSTAIDSYARVVAMWARADDALQPFVAESRAALQRLGADRRAQTPMVR